MRFIYRSALFFIHGAADDLAEIQRVVFAVDVHIARYDGIELALAHFAYVDDLAFEVQGALGDGNGFDLFCGNGLKAELFELIDFPARHGRALIELCVHIRHGNVDDKTLVFVYQIVGEFFSAHGKNEHIPVPHSSQRSPPRVHDIYFVPHAAGDENAAQLNGVENEISLSVRHDNLLLIRF